MNMLAEPADPVFYRLKFATLHADDLKIRALMAWASVAWALDLIIQPDIFERPYYALMKLFPAWTWAIAFAIHFVGASISIGKGWLHGRFATWVNGWGCIVWFAATLAQNLSQGRFLISTSLEILCTFELFLVWMRTQKRA